MSCLLRRRKRLLLVAIPVTIAFLLVLVVFYDRHLPPKVKARFPVGRPSGVSSPFIATFPPPRLLHDGRHDDEAGIKTVVLWTSFFGLKNWGNGTPFGRCPVAACRLSTDKGEISQAHAALMNVRDISDLPPTHPNDQVWIMHVSEPPYYHYLDLSLFRSVFNWTSSYRTDADIFSPYNSFVPLQNIKQPLPDDSHRQFQEPAPESLNLQLKAANLSTSQQDASQDQNAPASASQGPEVSAAGPDIFSSHDLLVFWAASSCINYSQRYKFVADLQRFIHVDTYGACGELVCLRGSVQCDSLLRRYKFRLSLENGYCRDYITEKYWEALSRHQIPIVMGGADYSKLAIPGSYIDVDDFATTEALAAFVQRVGNDQGLYNSFHTWRTRFRLQPSGIVDWCQLCRALHERRPPQTYTNMETWMSQDTCPLSSKFEAALWIRDYVLFKLFGV